MMLQGQFWPYQLQFRFEAGTSRGSLLTKDSWLLAIHDGEGHTGWGECSIIPNLSPDPVGEIPQTLSWLINHLYEDENLIRKELTRFPAILFAWETAVRDLEQGGQRILYPSEFTRGEAAIPINGLIWMGDKALMSQRIAQKIDEGFRCLKLKIGAIDFRQELELLSHIRKQFNPDELEIRVDANGAFAPEDAMNKLHQLAPFRLHSIEQPIAAGQWDAMASLCMQSPVPIALDEELIGLNHSELNEMLTHINPPYLILKPSLLGGLKNSEQVIALAGQHSVSWWVTSALESNIGLNAIAQWTYILNNPMPHGLGTGQLYHNNIDSPLKVSNGFLRYNPSMGWDEPADKLKG